MLSQGGSKKAEQLRKFLSDIEYEFAKACTDFEDWRQTQSRHSLQQTILWLTKSGSYDVFKSCLFGLQCQYPTYGHPEDWEIVFYTAHPWLTRAGMRELLSVLVANADAPSPEVLFCLAIQHSASPLNFEDYDLNYADPLVQIRTQGVWAMSVIEVWQKSTEFDELWSAALNARELHRFADLRRNPAFTKLANFASSVLISKWQTDFEKVRWKAEHSAYLALKTLLPDLEVFQHASPIWLAPQHLDIFVPAANLAVEYQGEQHFAPIEIFGGQAGFEATVKRDVNKQKLCELAGLRLEYIRYDEDVDQRLIQISEAIKLG